MIAVYLFVGVLVGTVTLASVAYARRPLLGIAMCLIGLLLFVVITVALMAAADEVGWSDWYTGVVATPGGVAAFVGWAMGAIVGFLLRLGRRSP